MNCLSSFFFILFIIKHLYCCGIIYPIKGDTIVCDNTCTTCTIICDKPSQCKDGIIVYSSSLNTNITCSGKDSCQKSTFNIGNHNYNQYNRESFNNLIINCIGGASCKETIFNINGFYNNKPIFNAFNKINNNNNDHFQSSKLLINIKSNMFELNCGENHSSCVNTQYLCSNDNVCQCYGNGCVYLANYQSIAKMLNINGMKDDKITTNIPTINPIIMNKIIIKNTDINNDENIIKTTKKPTLYPSIIQTTTNLVDTTIIESLKPTQIPIIIDIDTEIYNFDDNNNWGNDLNNTKNKLFSLQKPKIYILLITCMSLVAWIFCLIFLIKSKKLTKTNQNPPQINKNNNKSISNNDDNESIDIAIALPSNTNNEIANINKSNKIIILDINNGATNNTDQVFATSDHEYNENESESVTDDDISHSNQNIGENITNYIEHDSILNKYSNNSLSNENELYNMQSEGNNEKKETEINSQHLSLSSLESIIGIDNNIQLINSIKLKYPKFEIGKSFTVEDSYIGRNSINLSKSDYI